ncbi:MAG: sterol desaturase family protein [Oleispira sp.]
MNNNKNLIYKLFNSEIPDISDSWVWMERLFLAGFILVFTLIFVRTYPTIFLGFGLGDEYDWGLIFSFFEDIKAQSPALFYASIFMLSANLLFRFQLFIRGQFSYRSNHPDLPIKTVALYIIANALNIVFVAVTVLLLGLLSYGLDYDFNSGFNAVENLFNLALTFAKQVPTLVELPLVAAFILTYIIQGFFHYWIHRLCHLNRFLWLVLHRFHHMPTVLTPSTTNVVITSVPFFIGIVFVKTFIFSVIAKLFYEQDLFMEMFFFHLIITFADPYGHQTALFKEGIKSRWISALCFFSGNGVYHYLHHSRDAEIVTSNTTNQVNIGGGIAYIWDHIFGTFKGLPSVADPTPAVGLWGNPTLHHNPIRLLLSGLIQVVYEIYANKGIKSKLLCVFGSVNYTPPISRRFHISEKSSKNDASLQDLT